MKTQDAGYLAMKAQTELKVTRTFSTYLLPTCPYIRAFALYSLHLCLCIAVYSESKLLDRCGRAWLCAEHLQLLWTRRKTAFAAAFGFS